MTNITVTMRIQQPIGMYRNSPFEWISVKFDEFIILDLISIWYGDYKQSFSTMSIIDPVLPLVGGQGGL